MGIDDPVSGREFIYPGQELGPIFSPTSGKDSKSDLENILKSKKNGEMKIIIHCRLLEIPTVLKSMEKLSSSYLY